MDEEMIQALQGLTVPLWHETEPSAARALGIKSRAAAYRAGADGSIPMIQIGRLKRSPCARLRAMLGLPAFNPMQDAAA